MAGGPTLALNSCLALPSRKLAIVSGTRVGNIVSAAQIGPQKEGYHKATSSTLLLAHI